MAINVKRRIQLSASLLSLISFFVFFSDPLATKAQTVPRVLTHFYGQGGVSWSKLASGGYGSGYILYYLKANGLSRPSIVVDLEHQVGQGSAIAYIYQTPSGETHVPISVNSSSFRILNNLKPSIIITAQDGWWVRGSVPNYNIHVDIYGQVFAMWGEQEYINKLGPTDWNFAIDIRADKQGFPLWDLRRLVPALSDMGIYRTNYAQRESDEAFVRVQSVSPLFPYISTTQTAFEQSNGRFAPPIVVDWPKGRITTFSEAVTVRNQNTSYDFYSITPIQLGRINTPDFESPWGLYDLSGRGQGYPNLLIRNEHYYAFDPWYTGFSTSVDAPPLNKSNEVVRYSWADHPGNQLFDYKVDVFGFHQYRQTLSIAGGLARVVAPAYQDYPRWVVNQPWPVATFVDTNGGGYPTSEGIYDWSSRNIGPWYWRGWTSQPDLSGFQTISKGLRGEYRLGVNQKPLLYMSPVDNRLHLESAQGGLWNLGNGMTLKETNLRNGKYIDDWKLLRKQKVVSQLAQIDGYMIEGDSAGIRVKKSGISQSLFTILPPTNHQTWVQFSQRVAEYKGKNPSKLFTWMQNTTGDTVVLRGATLVNIRPQTHGFDLVMHTKRSLGGSQELFGSLKTPAAPGMYVYHYDAKTMKWSVKVARPVKIQTSASIDFDQSSATIQLDNIGDELWQAGISVKIGSQIFHISNLNIEGGATNIQSVQFFPEGLRSLPVEVQSGSTQLFKRNFLVPTFTRPSFWRMLVLSSPHRWTMLTEIFVLTIFLAGMTIYIIFWFPSTTINVLHRGKEQQKECL